MFIKVIVLTGGVFVFRLGLDVAWVLLVSCTSGGLGTAVGFLVRLGASRWLLSWSWPKYL